VALVDGSLDSVSVKQQGDAEVVAESRNLARRRIWMMSSLARLLVRRLTGKNQRCGILFYILNLGLLVIHFFHVPRAGLFPCFGRPRDKAAPTSRRVAHFIGSYLQYATYICYYEPLKLPEMRDANQASRWPC
jgi:hypothetical protein